MTKPRHILEHDACGYVPLSTARMLLRQKCLYRIKRAPKFAVSGQIVHREDSSPLVFIERAIEGFSAQRPEAKGRRRPVKP